MYALLLDKWWQKEQFKIANWTKEFEAGLGLKESLLLPRQEVGLMPLSLSLK
jgi:hypothetical protein